MRFYTKDHHSTVIINIFINHCRIRRQHIFASIIICLLAALLQAACTFLTLGWLILLHHCVIFKFKLTRKKGVSTTQQWHVKIKKDLNPDKCFSIMLENTYFMTIQRKQEAEGCWKITEEKAMLKRRPEISFLGPMTRWSFYKKGKQCLFCY